MKIRNLLILTVLAVLLSACSHYTCPTYDNSSGEQKYHGKNRSTSKGLFPKNMQ